ncbi:MAG: DUF3592 domain-containing protein [Bacteroidetes bacterium]|nr:DUF3592 domain-containing protein [Bacteroidota bacterium]
MKKLFIFLIAFGLLFIIIGIVMLVNNQSFRSNAIIVEGTVVEMRIKTSDRGSGMEAPVIDYKAADGSEHTYLSTSFSYPPQYEVGEKVKVYCNPNNPDDATIGSGSVFPIIFVIVGIFPFLIGVLLLRYKIRKVKTNTILLQTGQKIQADIISIDYNRGLTVNDKNPLQIECQWLQAFDNTVYVFRSDNLWFDPRPFLGDRTQLDVYIERENPKKYYVDVSFLPKMG